MEISVKANELKNSENGIKGLATISFGEGFKIRSVAVVEGPDGKMFVSMPNYKTKNVDENGNAQYKDICNPITKDFRDQLYGAILESFESGKEVSFGEKDGKTIPDIIVKAVVLEGGNGSTKGLARLYLDDVFVVNNVAIKESKDGDLFMSMPSYKTNQFDEHGKTEYKDIAYPVTKEFRSQLQSEVISKFLESRDLKRDSAEEEHPFVEGKEPTVQKIKDSSPKEEKASIKEKIANGEAKKMVKKEGSKAGTPKKEKETEIA
ncbi:MAG: SpoVG family protein [Mobilitalea sp.]